MTEKAESNQQAAASLSTENRTLTQRILRQSKTHVVAGLLTGLAGAGVSLIIPPTFTARTTFLSPQPQSQASAALSQLGALAGIAGSTVGSLKNPADQYIALLQSERLSNSLIERFKLKEVYDAKFLVDARLTLQKNARFAVGKKDNLITIEVDDKDPSQAAAMANAFLEELKRLTAQLALTEPQQRKVFFESQFKDAHEKLAAAQALLQNTGFNPAALKAEPKSTAETYANLRAQVAATELRVEVSRQRLTDDSPELRSQLAALNGLKKQLSGLEAPSEGGTRQDYLGVYREFKYREALFDIMSRQFELAKLDEARDAALFQIVDIASAPERRSAPKRSMITLIGVLFGVCLSVAISLRRQPATYR